MEINQLRVHERVINFFYRNFEQGVFRVDEEGYEYVDEKYINLYDYVYFIKSAGIIGMIDEVRVRSVLDPFQIQ